MTQANDDDAPRYKRVVLKLSGESLCRPGERGINMDEVFAIASQVKQALALGCQIGLVVGGGNILRGAQFKTASGAKIEDDHLFCTVGGIQG